MIAAGPLAPAAIVSEAAQELPVLKPPRLREGDLVGLVNLSSVASDENIAKAVHNLEAQGFRVKPGRYIREVNGHYGGSVAQRVADLHAMFDDREVRAVWCVRGGAGCSALLPHVDYARIRRNPKILIGFSDVTAILLAVWRKARVVTFHGPVGTTLVSDFNVGRARALLMQPGVESVLPIAAENIQRSTVDTQYMPRVFRHGRATGRLAGGNLSIVSALVGTPYGIQPQGTLLFLEEVGEEPYRIDRMLTQLDQAGILGGAAGTALGVFQRCEAKPGEHSSTLAEVLESHFLARRQPSMYGLSIGHIPQQLTIPLGVRARLDTEAATLTLLETAVS
ncbi:MAG: LD-carboxypeptidase [Usitatibacter sp.]